MGETAKGDFPVICVKTMANISKEAESCAWNERMFEDMMRTEAMNLSECNITNTTAISAVLASYKCKAAAIVVLTASGNTSHIVSKYRPSFPSSQSPGIHRLHDRCKCTEDASLSSMRKKEEMTGPRTWITESSSPSTSAREANLYRAVTMSW